MHEFLVYQEYSTTGNRYTSSVQALRVATEEAGSNIKVTTSTDLYGRQQWCVRGSNGVWRVVPVRAI